jgi:hypothetical protein
MNIDLITSQNINDIMSLINPVPHSPDPGHRHHNGLRFIDTNLYLNVTSLINPEDPNYTEPYGAWITEVMNIMGVIKTEELDLEFQWDHFYRMASNNKEVEVIVGIKMSPEVPDVWDIWVYSRDICLDPNEAFLIHHTLLGNEDLMSDIIEEHERTTHGWMIRRAFDN